MQGGLGLAVSAKNPGFVVELAELAGLELGSAESSAHGCTNMDFLCTSQFETFYIVLSYGRFFYGPLVHLKHQIHVHTGNKCILK